MKLVAKFTLVFVIVFGIGFSLAAYMAHGFLQKNATDEVIQLANGCLCCRTRQDLVLALDRLLHRRAGGSLPPFRRIVIETTGLADPAPILFTLGTDPMLDHRLRLAAVVTLVDAVNGAETLARFPEAGRQAALADLLVITKTDLAPLSLELVRRLDAVNSRAERTGEIEPAMTFCE